MLWLIWNVRLVELRIKAIHCLARPMLMRFSCKRVVSTYCSQPTIIVWTQAARVLSAR